MGLRKTATDIQGVHRGKMPICQRAGEYQPGAGRLEGFQVFRIVKLKGCILEDTDGGSV